jgi:hypothetical protein
MLLIAADGAVHVTVCFSVAACCVFVCVLLQDLSLWLYSLALLHITPSPLWCTSYVEASYSRLTARSTHPQVGNDSVMLSSIVCSSVAKTQWHSRRARHASS